MPLRITADHWVPGLDNGPEGKGHTFESCRVRQESVCRACRDCGGLSGELDHPTIILEQPKLKHFAGTFFVKHKSR
jgi:hypothetical protein